MLKGLEELWTVTSIKMTANNTKPYLVYFNKLVDEHNNTYHRSIGKKNIDSDYSDLTEELETNPEPPTFKVGDSVRITNYNIFSRGYTESWSE